MFLWRKVLNRTSGKMANSQSSETCWKYFSLQGNSVWSKLVVDPYSLLDLEKSSKEPIHSLTPLFTAVVSSALVSPEVAILQVSEWKLGYNFTFLVCVSLRALIELSYFFIIWHHYYDFVLHIICYILLAHLLGLHL